MYFKGGFGSQIGSVKSFKESQTENQKQLYMHAIFDPHKLAEDKKNLRDSQNIKTIEDVRQKLIDILVRKIKPRHHILDYTEQFTQNSNIKKDESFNKVKDLLEQNV